jgi:zinc transport system substrate-binding protein
VYVVNYPLEYFATRIGGQHVEVRFPAPSDVDPAYWSPPVETIVEYQNADLILLNGAGYARWVSHATLAARKLVDTSASFRDRYIDLSNAPTHAHGPEGEHAHTGYAFTTWLDPLLAIEQASAIADALSVAAPMREAAFRAAFDRLKADIEELDARLVELLAGDRREHFLFSHPVYQYLQRRYDVSGRSFHWEPDGEPTQADWQELKTEAGRLADPIMLWEAQPLASTQARLAEHGVRSVVYAPGGNRPTDGDWLAAMHANAERLETALTPAR